MRNFNIVAMARQQGAIGEFSEYRTSVTVNAEWLARGGDLTRVALDAVTDDGREVHHIVTIEEQTK